VGRRLGETPLQTPPAVLIAPGLPKTRIFPMWAKTIGHFALRLCKLEHGDIETGSQFVKSRNWRALIGITDQHSLVE
jgi:hypothetical protein